MSLTLNTKVYNFDTSRSPDIARYKADLTHSYSAPDYVDAKRTEPKSLTGVGKASVKITRNVTDGTLSLGNGILEVSTSFPVGAVKAELQAMIDDMAAWLATSVADDIFIDQNIRQ